MAGNRASGVGEMKAVDQRVTVADNRNEIEEISLRRNENVSGSDMRKNILPEAVDEGACYHENDPIL